MDLSQSLRGLSAVVGLMKWKAVSGAVSKIPSVLYLRKNACIYAVTAGYEIELPNFCVEVSPFFNTVTDTPTAFISPILAHSETDAIVRRPSSVRLYVRLSVRLLTFCAIASSTRQIARSRPNLHSVLHGRACIQDVLKVEVKDHVIWALS